MNLSIPFKIAGCAALSMHVAQAQAPTKQGFEQYIALLGQAVKILDAVKTPEQLPSAMQQLQKIQQQLSANPAIKDVLQLQAKDCPSDLKALYNQAAKLNMELKDAGKRLAMSGILKDSKDASLYANFQASSSMKESDVQLPAGKEGAPAESKQARDARMQWWRDGKFGMFIHYGLYSGLGGEVMGKKYQGCVEWIQMQSGLDSQTYAQQAMDKFTPRQGAAAEWVALAKKAGCKYTVLTSRHHEGFNLFESKYSDFNSKKLKGIDIVKEYSEACKKYDMKKGYYVSIIDWSHPDYDPSGSGVSYPAGNYEAQKQGKRQFGNHQKYKDYLYNITDELYSNYGGVDLIWWDFSQPRFQGDHAWGATKLMQNLFAKNPKAIQNNRLYHSSNHLSEGGIQVTPTWKGDYSTAEHHIPATGIDGDWEACQTLNGTWGYSKENQKWKTSTQLIQELIDTVSRGGNFLLNIGPEADGSIPKQSVVIFEEIGKWMEKNGEAIYGTRANPLNMELTWGRITRKGDDITYILAYKKPENNKLIIPCTFEGPVKATLLVGGKEIKLTQDAADKSTAFDISDVVMDPAATVIKVEGKRVLR